MKSSVSSFPNSIGQRLRVEMKTRGVSSAELAKRADVKTSFIYDVISGKSANPSTVKLARVASGLGINLSALLDSDETGSAETLNAGDYASVSRLMVDASGELRVATPAKDSEAFLFHKRWISEHLGINPSGLRTLLISGDSMEPTLYHNDMVLVDTNQKSPSSPGIFALFDGFDLTVKRVEYADHGAVPRVRILSDNPHYSIHERLAADTVIIGRIVWFSREI